MGMAKKTKMVQKSLSPSRMMRVKRSKTTMRRKAAIRRNARRRLPRSVLFLFVFAPVLTVSAEYKTEQEIQEILRRRRRIRRRRVDRDEPTRHAHLLPQVSRQL